MRQSAHPLKKEVLLCISELTESDGGDEDLDESATWLNAIDRGRLVHVYDILYTLFVAM